MLAWLVFGSAWVVLYLGTVVTGSGPHAGDEDAVRNGLDPLQVSQLHADSVFLFLGLCVGLFFAVRAAWSVDAAAAVAARVIVLQGTVGFVQYATDLPIVLVGFHMLGAALVSAAVTWVLMSVREPVGRRWVPGAAVRQPPFPRPRRCQAHRRSVPTPGSGEIGTVRHGQTVPRSPLPGAPCVHRRFRGSLVQYVRRPSAGRGNACPWAVATLPSELLSARSGWPALAGCHRRVLERRFVRLHPESGCIATTG